MQPHVERLVVERDELEKKLQKLEDFIFKSEVFKTLTQYEQYLLIKQEAYMS